MEKITKTTLMNVISQYNLIGELESIEPYGNGHINDTYRLVNKAGNDYKTYILQRMNSHIFKNCTHLMENIQNVTDFLKEKIQRQGGNPDQETLQVIPTKTGKSYATDESGENWRAYIFIENSISYEQAESPELLRKGGYAFGNFQYLLSDFPAEKLHETIPNFHNTADRFEKFKKAVSQDVMGRAKEVQKEIKFIMDREKDCHFFNDLLANGEVPLRVTHNDTKLNNVLFSVEDENVACVVDLDTVMPGFAAHDFGDTIRFGASTATEDETDLSKVSCSMELYEAYLEGFMKGCRGSLTRREIETLPMGAKIMTFEVGMRFLTDYLEGDVYFKIHREGHNLERCRTQLKLVADMEEKWEIMNVIVKKYL